MKLRIVRILILITLSQNILFGQENLRREVIPPSPNAASLGKYGDIPVSLYTGIPQITVPLYEIKGNGFSLPIHLSYHAGGVKVEEVASSVGLAWSLNAGGVITRTVRGRPDELGYSSAESPNDADRVNGFEQLSETAKNTFLYNVTHGYADSEPDLYFFNFDGRSGKIVFDKNGIPAVIPYQQIRISGNYSDGFVITTEDGTRYEFFSAETTETFTTPSSDIDENLKSSWYLSSILYSNGKSVGFTYEQNLITHEPHHSEVWYDRINPVAQCDAIIRQAQTVRSETQALRLTEIMTDNVIVKLKYHNLRTDLEGDKSLDTMLVFDRHDKILKQIAFTYNQTDWNRLRLDRVQEFNGKEKLPPYRFEYHPQSLPPIKSKAQDHWGFYNGAMQNTLIPATNREYALPGNLLFEGANRNPSEYHTLAGVLSRVHYPTGGFTQFDFELNDYGFINASMHNRREIIDTSATVSANPLEITTIPLTITDEQEVVVKFGFTRNYQGDTGSGFEAIVGLREKNTNISYYLDLVTNDGESGKIELPPGEYELHIEASGDRKGTAYMEYRKFTGTILHHSPVGGLRIKTVSNYLTEAAGSVPIGTAHYLYRMSDDITRSSGVISSLPAYHYFYNETKQKPLGNTGSLIISDCYYLVRKSGSLALGSTQGSNVGYQFVTVLNDESGQNGKTTNSFTSFVEYPDVHISGFGFPFAPPTSNSHKHGLLKEQIIYKKTNSGYDTLKRLVNDYKIEERNRKEVRALTAGVRYMSMQGTPEYAVGFSKYVSEWLYPSKTIEHTYSGASVHTKISDFTYENPLHAQLTKVSQLLSSGDTLTTIFRYPLDYTISVANDEYAAAIKKMQGDFLLNRRIEKSEWRVKGTTSKFLGAELNAYKIVNDALVVDHSLKVLTPPDDQFTFQPCAITLNGNFTSDPSYRNKLVFEKYDLDNNIVETLSAAGERKSYMWSYHGALPIAEVSNAFSDEIFHTSFEEATDASDEFKTGRRSHQGPFSIPLPQKTGHYVLSYWLKSGPDSQWAYVEQIVNLEPNSTNISIGTGAGWIDEVRIYPVNSSMRTFTYNEGIGISSSTDQNNKTNYY